MGESHTGVNSGLVSDLAVPVLLRTIYIDRLIKSFHPAERKIVPHYSRTILILMIQEAKEVDSKNNTETR